VSLDVYAHGEYRLTSSSHRIRRPRNLHRIHSDSVLPPLSFHPGRRRRWQDHGRQVSRGYRRRRACAELVPHLRIRQRHAIHRSQHHHGACGLHDWVYWNSNDHVLAAVYAA
jgi:hypothetical protein